MARRQRGIPSQASSGARGTRGTKGWLTLRRPVLAPVMGEGKAWRQRRLVGAVAKQETPASNYRLGAARSSREGDGLQASRGRRPGVCAPADAQREWPPRRARSPRGSSRCAEGEWREGRTAERTRSIVCVRLDLPPSCSRSRDVQHDKVTAFGQGSRRFLYVSLSSRRAGRTLSPE